MCWKKCSKKDKTGSQSGLTIFSAQDELEDFRRLYPRLLESLTDRDMVLVGVPNSAQASVFVEGEAHRIGAPYVPAVSGPTKADGLHHTVAGSRAYRDAIAGGCSRAEAIEDGQA